MLSSEAKSQIFAKGKPEPSNVIWWGEPNFGAWYTDAEIDAVVSAIRESNSWSSGFGPNSETIEEFESAFAEYCDAKFAIATNSCGTGLDMAIRCLDLQPGDEVISPAINYKAAHLAILGQSGKVVFCDIDPKTLNLDPQDVERRITQRTRAILPVHMNGLSAPLDELLHIAEKYPHPEHGPLKIIGDAARSCGASYMGQKVGAKGWMTVFSFHTQKLMTTLGEGGAITTNDSQLASRLRDMRQFGGETGWGSNFKMTKIQAAVGLVQLRRLDEMNRRRREAANRRSRILADEECFILPYEPPGYEHVYYTYSLLVCPEWAGENRDMIIRQMRDEAGIACSISNRPTYQRWPFIAQNCRVTELEVSEDVGRRLLCPPLHPLLNDDQELYICANLLEARDRIKNGRSEA